MVLIALALLCVVTVPLTGGRFSALAELRVRGLWIPIVAVAVQVVITVVAPAGNAALHRGLHIGTYAMIGLFLWVNRRIPGIWLLALGTTLNATVIVANLGVMPASVTAERISGLHLRAGFDNSAPVAHPLLPWLGDILPWPGPLANVLSVGDLLIFAGVVLLLHRCCAPVPGERRARRLRLLEAEADPHLDLEVGDLAPLHVPADRADLDPVEVAQGRRRPSHA